MANGHCRCVRGVAVSNPQTRSKPNKCFLDKRQKHLTQPWDFANGLGIFGNWPLGF